MAQQPGFVATATSVPNVAPEDALKAMQRHAWDKKYSIRIDFIITETEGNMPYYDAHSNWNGIHYGVVVATEAEMVALMDKFRQLGAAVSSGTPPV